MAGHDRRSALLALHPGVEDFTQLGEWLSETERYEPDEAAGQAGLSYDPPANLDACRQHAIEARDRHPPEDVTARALLPQHGVPPPGVAPE